MNLVQFLLVCQQLRGVGAQLRGIGAAVAGEALTSAPFGQLPLYSLAPHKSEWGSIRISLKFNQWSQLSCCLMSEGEIGFVGVT